MKIKFTLLLMVCLLLFAGQSEAKKWKSLFNGKDLKGGPFTGKPNGAWKMVY